MGQILTLAYSKEGVLEESGMGISSKKILQTGGKLQNYVFLTISRSQGEEATLTRESVLNIQNQDTKLFLATKKLFSTGEEDSEEDNDEELKNVREDIEKDIAQPITKKRSRNRASITSQSILSDKEIDPPVS